MKYDFDEEFQTVLSEIVVISPSEEDRYPLQAARIDTPLGAMVAMGDRDALYLLEFIDRPGLEKDLLVFREKNKFRIVPGKSDPIYRIEAELQKYFSGMLATFSTPIFPLGSLFQQQVWRELQKIPRKETRSYGDIALAMGNPGACRAIGSANRSNRIAIVIPCHRVINAGGNIGGYAGGIQRKEWLLRHERTY